MYKLEGSLDGETWQEYGVPWNDGEMMPTFSHLPPFYRIVHVDDFTGDVKRGDVHEGKCEPLFPGWGVLRHEWDEPFCPANWDGITFVCKRCRATFAIGTSDLYRFGIYRR